MSIIPLLFNLALDPLARLILQSPEIQGVKIEKIQVKMSMLADDILLYTTDPDNTLPRIKDILDAYGKLSGFKINQNKSELLPLKTEKQNKDENHPTLLPTNNNHVKYIGIQIGKSPSTIYTLNFPP